MKRITPRGSHQRLSQQNRHNATETRATPTTGLTREHALFFLWGTGANGKGTFVNAIAGILADYHHTAPIETFTVTYGDRHPMNFRFSRALPPGGARTRPRLTI